MTDKVIMYIVYLALSVALTIWVGRTLSRNGKVFLEDAFADERLAGSVNQLLVVGFYLLNLGFVSLAMRDASTVDQASVVLEQLSKKVGLVLLVLGVVHLFNLSALGRYRRARLRTASAMPPLPPAGLIVPQPLTPPTVPADAAERHAAAQRATAAEQAGGWPAPRDRS